MRAVTYQGPKDIKVIKVDAPKIEKADDIIIKVTSTAICGSDLHIYWVQCQLTRIMSSDMNQWVL